MSESDSKMMSDLGGSVLPPAHQLIFSLVQTDCFHVQLVFTLLPGIFERCFPFLTTLISLFLLIYLPFARVFMPLFKLDEIDCPRARSP